MGRWRQSRRAYIRRTPGRGTLALSRRVARGQVRAGARRSGGAHSWASPEDYGLMQRGVVRDSGAFYRVAPAFADGGRDLSRCFPRPGRAPAAAERALHVRALRRRGEQPTGRRCVTGGRRQARQDVQPAFPLWRRRPGQDTSDARDRARSLGKRPHAQDLLFVVGAVHK